MIICPKCREVLSQPLRNFTDCYIDLGVTGDDELRKACEEYQRVDQKLWGLIAKHNFQFIEDE